MPSDFAHHYSRVVRYGGSEADDDTVYHLLHQLRSDPIHQEPGAAHRLVTADAMDEVGRHEEAGYLRGDHPIGFDENDGDVIVRRRPTDAEREAFRNGYVTTAAWTTSDDYGDSITPGQIHPDTVRQMHEDADAFLDEHNHLIVGKPEHYYGLDPDDEHEVIAGRMRQAGGDFWLSRNGHGAGYFDGYYRGHEHHLQQRAREYGSSGLYQGEDGLYHGM